MNTITTAYELRVAGHLDDHWANWLGDLTLVRDDDGTTVLTGRVADQAQHHGILAAVRDLGAPLLSLHTLDPDFTNADATAAPVRPALEHPLSTERLTLRLATPDDADATWKYRRLESV